MANSNPKVSVILPIYSVRDFIGECVESLLAQTLDDFEVICVDDGSPDDSVDIARRIVGDDARFQFVEQENAGLSAARNHGLRIARGDYITFLDSDDLYVPEALELLYLTAVADHLDYLDFTAHAFYESAHMRRILNEDYFEQRTDIEGVMTGPQLFTRYQQLDEYCCPACFHFFARTLIEKSELRFVEGIIHEDELFSPLLIAQAQRAAFLNEPLYLRRMRDASIMNTRRGIRNIEGVLYVATELESWLCGYAKTPDCDREFVRALAERIAMLRWIAVADALGVQEQDLRSYAAQLDGKTLVDFELNVTGGLYTREKTRIELDWRRLRKAAHTVLDGPIALIDSLTDRFGR